MKKKIFLCFLSIFLCLSLCFCCLFSSKNILSNKITFAEEISELYVDFSIYSYEDLLRFANDVTNNRNTYKGKKVGLFSNIEVDSSFVSIGKMIPMGIIDSSILEVAFQGEFYGNNHTIDGLTKPLFENTKNAKISNITITGTISSSSIYTGGIVCKAENTTIFQCKNQASINNKHTDILSVLYTGGIVGYAKNCNIEQCSNDANIQNKSNIVLASYVGGIAGYCENTKINNCYTYDSTITTNAIENTSSPENILKGQQKNSLTLIAGWFDSLLDEYTRDREKLYTENEEKNKLIDDYMNWCYLADNYEAYGDWEGGWEKTSWWPHIPWWNAHHHWNPNKYNAWETTKKRAEYWWEAQKAWWKLGIEGDWATAFKAGWNSLKNSLITGLKQAYNKLYETYKSFSANNHYSFVSKMTKTTISQNAYAFGIAYLADTKSSINNCYTSNIELDSGQKQFVYDYTVSFTNEVHFVVESDLALAHTKDINIQINQTYNLNGLISNQVKSNCYYYDNENQNLELYVYATDMQDSGNVYNSDTTTHMKGTFAMKGKILDGLISTDWFDSQNVEIRINKQNSVSVYGAKNGDGVMCLISTPNLTTLYPNSKTFIDYNIGKQSSKSNTLPKGFDSNIWSIDSSINNGFPHLKYRYWQDVS